MQAPSAREMPAESTDDKATANIDLDSPEAQKALSFLKDHHTVVDPTMALFEFFTATTAKPPASFEPGVNKVAPELAEQLTDVAPPTRAFGNWRKSIRKGVGDRRSAASRRNSDRCRHRSDRPRPQPASRNRVVRAGRIHAHGSDSGRDHCPRTGDGIRERIRYSRKGQSAAT